MKLTRTGGACMMYGNDTQSLRGGQFSFGSHLKTPESSHYYLIHSQKSKLQPANLPCHRLFLSPYRPSSVGNVMKTGRVWQGSCSSQADIKEPQDCDKNIQRKARCGTETTRGEARVSGKKILFIFHLKNLIHLILNAVYVWGYEGLSKIIATGRWVRNFGKSGKSIHMELKSQKALYLSVVNSISNISETWESW